MEEVFKTIELYPDYEISNCGRVRTKSRLIRYTHAVTGGEHFRESTTRYLKEYNTVHGYKFVQPYKDKKPHNCPIHRLVAKTFIDNPNNHNVVNHKDGNKHNNHVDNLEWCTDAYNHEHATKTGLIAKGSEVGTSVLNENMVHAIKWFLLKGVSHTELGKAFKVSRSTISLIHEGKTWAHISLTGTELNIEL